MSFMLSCCFPLLRLCCRGFAHPPLSPVLDHPAFHNAPPVPGPAGALPEPHHSLGPRYQTTHPAPKGPREGPMLWHPVRFGERGPTAARHGPGEAAGLSALTVHTTTRGRSHVTKIKAHIQNLLTTRHGSAGGGGDSPSPAPGCSCPFSLDGEIPVPGEQHPDSRYGPSDSLHPPLAQRYQQSGEPDGSSANFLSS